MKGNSLKVLNAIRSVAGSDYQARIPEAVRTNIAEVGNTILSYTPHTNLMLTQLINRIGRVTIERMESMDDVYGAFKESKLSKGDTIQKIFIDIPKAHAFEGTNTLTPTSMLSIEKGVIHVEYTSVDRRMFYKRTISKSELQEAFISVEALDDFIRGIIESMMTALGYDKYIMVTEALYEHCKYVVEVEAQASGDAQNKVKVLHVPSTVAKYNKTTKEIEWDTVGAKDFLKILRIVTGNMKFPHALGYATFDSNGDIDDEYSIEAQRTPRERQILGLEVSSMANIDVDALATLFNLAKADLKTQVIELEDDALGLYVDSDSNEVYVGGFICDKNAVDRGTSFEDTDSFKNPEHEYVNFWRHFWGWIAISKFKDFVPIVFTTYTPTQSEGE